MSDYTPPPIATPLSANLGGTGIANNAASTLTINGNFGTTVTVSGATTVTLPTTGTLLSSTAEVITTLTTEQMRLRYDASNYLSVTVGSTGRPMLNAVGSDADMFEFDINGVTRLFLQSNNVVCPSAGGTTGAFCVSVPGTFTSGLARFCVNTSNPTAGSEGAGLGDGGSNHQVSLVTHGVDRVLCTDTKFSVLSGIQFQVGNNATTGLIAGALAALTTASIVIYDATGTAYRVPCITP